MKNRIVKDEQTVMQERKHGKQEKIGQAPQANNLGYITCQMCGRKIESDTCSWQEDDGEAMYCEDCRAEKDSCGCSD